MLGGTCGSRASPSEARRLRRLNDVDALARELAAADTGVSERP